MLHDVNPQKNDDGNLQNSLNSCFLPERSVPRQRQVFGITALEHLLNINKLIATVILCHSQVHRKRAQWFRRRSPHLEKREAS